MAFTSKTLAVACVLGFCAVLPLKAEPAGFHWEGELRFAPGDPAETGGGTMSDLFRSLGAPGAESGKVPVSGTFRYETEVQAEAMNQIAAGYPRAVTSASIVIAGKQSTAAMAMIEQNASTSRVGFVAGAGGSFCGDADHCDMGGIVAPGWGNQIAMLNDTPHILLDETGTNPKAGDALAYMVGRTAATGEFMPPFFRTGAEPIYVDGLSVLMFSRPDVQMIPSLAIPRIADVDYANTVGRTEIWLFLEGPSLPQTLRVEGVLTGIAPLP